MGEIWFGFFCFFLWVNIGFGEIWVNLGDIPTLTGDTTKQIISHE